MDLRRTRHRRLLEVQGIIQSTPCEIAAYVVFDGFVTAAISDENVGYMISESAQEINRKYSSSIRHQKRTSR